MVTLRKTTLPVLILVLLLVLPLFSDLQSPSQAGQLVPPDSTTVPVAAQELDQAVRTEVLASYGNLPLLFIPNNGQVDSSVLYYAPVSGGKVYLTSSSIVLDLTCRDSVNSTGKIDDVIGEGQQAGYQQLVLRLNLEAASDNPTVLCREKSESRVNYIIGNDPADWFTDIPTYKEIVYSDIYPDIDLRLYGKEGTLTYDFIVHPGGDISDIRLSLGGIESLDLSGRDLVLNTAFGQMRQGRLNIYQGDGVCRHEIEGNFKLLSANSYGFAVAAYDSKHDLVIDPALVYSTYLGGGGSDMGWDIVVDAAGCAYVSGATDSNPFPTTPGAFQTALGGGFGDSFITKLNATGSGLVYSTYVGGGGEDNVMSMAVDTAGCAYITGLTKSDPFPTTPGAFQTVYGGGAYDAYVTKLNAAGNALVYSTYLGGGGGTEQGFEIAVDAAGNAYVTGITDSDPFPTTPGAFQTAYGGFHDAFITKLNPTGSALVYSTYLGGAGNDRAWGIDIDAAGNAYVSGLTDSNPFPTTPGAFQSVFGGGTVDAFVTKLNAAGNALVYSTYLGGGGTERAGDIAVDAAGNAYVAGNTDSQAPNPFPTTPGAFQSVFGGGTFDAFVTKLNAAGNALVYSTYLGGSDNESGGIAIDAAGNAYVGGFTSSTNFPTTPGAFQTAYQGGVCDVFITKLNPTGTGLVYSTYLGGGGHDEGGAAVDAAGNAYVIGITDSNDFPTTPGAFQTTYQGGIYDAFVTKLTMVYTAPLPAPPTAAPQVKPQVSQRNPASMSVQSLGINPQQVYANQSVTITTNVVNTGDEAGSLNVILKINGQAEQTKPVSVGPQGTQPVKFTVTKAQPGTYTVDIGGQKGSFTVLGAGGSTAGTSSSDRMIGILIIIGALVLATVLVVWLLIRRPA